MNFYLVLLWTLVGNERLALQSISDLGTSDLMYLLE